MLVDSMQKGDSAGDDDRVTHLGRFTINTLKLRKALIIDGRDMEQALDLILAVMTRAGHPHLLYCALGDSKLPAKQVGQQSVDATSDSQHFLWRWSFCGVVSWFSEKKCLDRSKHCRVFCGVPSTCLFISLWRVAAAYRSTAFNEDGISTPALLLYNRFNDSRPRVACIRHSNFSPTGCSLDPLICQALCQHPQALGKLQDHHFDTDISSSSLEFSV